MRLELLKYGSPLHDEMVRLRNKILREPWGISFNPNDIEKEINDYLLACLENERIVGCCFLTKVSDTTLQLRQMAVDTDWQKKGIGQHLIVFAEKTALNNGFQSIVLHARKVAVEFYKKLGYEICGEEFIEVGLPHIEMKKRLTE